MPRLFAEAFLVSPAEPDSEPPACAYDERRAVNVLADGRPVVGVAAIGETTTLTGLVQEEKEDSDVHADDAALALETLTKIAREVPDRDATELLLGTETRQLPGEREDFLRDLDGGSHTAIQAEAEDFAHDISGAHCGPSWMDRAMPAVRVVR
jgi:hypothetical protein